MERPSVLVTNFLTPPVISAANERFSVTEAYNLAPDELVQEIGKHAALLCRSATRVTGTVLDNGAQGKLEVVASATSGIDHVDLESATNAGITVCRTPFAVTNSNAEFNIGAIIALSRNFLQSTRQLQEGTWDQQAVLGQEISGKKLGLIGCGRIGLQTAHYASIFNMEIIGHDPYVADEIFHSSGVRRVPLEEVLALSDYMVLNVPRTEETTDMIHDRELRLMKPTSYIVQAARGGVVNENALLKALAEQRIAGAAIDVYDNEPAIDPRFRKLGNVILTPHIGCSTHESRLRAGMFALEELGRYFHGETLQCKVETQQLHALGSSKLAFEKPGC